MRRRCVLIVGSGIAGLSAALSAAEHADVLVLTKAAAGIGSTAWAQGGIAAALAAGDSAALHARDTLAAGAGLAEEAAVRVLTEEAVERIADLVAAGVEFDRTENGFALGLEGAHSVPRILHAGGDATGAVIQAALLDRVRHHPAIRLREDVFVQEIVVHDDRVGGVVACAVGEDGALGERESIAADAVILATGGAGQVYAHTTNPTVATGDGVALAVHAGARVMDAEFFQFHPTVLAGTGFLISEAVRGEGAVLLDGAGRRFMVQEHPLAELAPRDIVARAITRVMAEQNGAPVRLDATMIGRRALERRFPTISRSTREAGWEWATEPVPVTPAAHFWMGGVATDLLGRTGLTGLGAVGETARTGAHGANRLASNSLLEGAVFGRRAGRAFALGTPAAAAPRPVRATAEVGPGGDLLPRETLQELMWQNVGLVRHAPGLRAAATALRATAAESLTTLRDAEDRNLLIVARTITESALRRRRSAGSHWRSDDPAHTLADSRQEVAVC